MNIGTIDTAVFYAINHIPHSWVLDGFFSIVSGIGDAGFIWVVIGIWLVVKENLKEKQFFLPLGLAGFFSWLLSEYTFKSIASRLRPSSILDDSIVVGFPNGYSFPSTHATLAFAFAYLLSYQEPRFRKWFYGLAVLVGFSRVYLGHHYPFDVLAGFVLGTVIGYTILLWYKQSKKKKDLNKPTRRKHLKKSDIMAK